MTMSLGCRLQGMHGQALLTSAPDGATSYIEADVRDPDTILGEAARTLDFGQNSASSYHLRSREQIGAFFDGLPLVPPGLVPASR